MPSTPEPTESQPPRIHDGLEGIVAAQTTLSCVDGERGELLIAGRFVEQIAPVATFEEVAWALWHGADPSPEELASMRSSLAAHRHLPAGTMALLRDAARRRIDPMEALRMGVSSLSTPVGGADAEREAWLAHLSGTAAIVGTYARLLDGEPPVTVNEELSHAGFTLHQMSGTPPSARRVRALDTYLNTISDHGFNASTFTARVIASTGSDTTSALVGAIGALKGPLHGGAPGPALDMVHEIQDLDRAREILTEKLDRGERLMGFGHRVYRTRDPRAEVLAAACAALYRADDPLYAKAQSVEQVVLELLRARKPDRVIETNVEFYTALVLHGLGLQTDQFTPLFAVGRTAGWLAHIKEQRANGRLIRPRSHYIGPTPEVS